MGNGVGGRGYTGRRTSYKPTAKAFWRSSVKKCSQQSLHTSSIQYVLMFVCKSVKYCCYVESGGVSQICTMCSWCLCCDAPGHGNIYHAWTLIKEPMAWHVNTLGKHHSLMCMVFAVKGTYFKTSKMRWFPATLDWGWKWRKKQVWCNPKA